MPRIADECPCVHYPMCSRPPAPSQGHSQSPPPQVSEGCAGILGPDPERFRGGDFNVPSFSDHNGGQDRRIDVGPGLFQDKLIAATLRREEAEELQRCSCDDDIAGRRRSGDSTQLQTRCYYEARIVMSSIACQEVNASMLGPNRQNPALLDRGQLA
ncbi:unnamed protein product [Pleuronectes platessa]|uniref:Uncharacterized protein n=1 Tax=Pleuronectes platessa TaxID=8262 RepID=A0A9N7Y4U1_PLEPL|nr:unnamed protein product [Pleuronectes platessa]